MHSATLDLAPMNLPFFSRFLPTLLVSIFAGAVAFARIVNWPYNELLAQADMVVILEAIENAPAKDPFPGDHARPDLEATDTRFKVYSVIKTTGDTPKELSVLHFTYAKRPDLIANGASFIRFPIGLVTYEKRELKDGKPTGEVERVQYQPRWLAFLKGRKDGRFEPLTGQYDAAYSFKELREASHDLPR
jgi:hypothetical protein